MSLDASRRLTTSWIAISRYVLCWHVICPGSRTMFIEHIIAACVFRPRVESSYTWHAHDLRLAAFILTGGLHRGS